VAPPSHLRALGLIAAVALATLAPGAGCGGDPGPSGPAVLFDACQPLVLLADPAATSAQSAGVAAGIGFWNAAARTKLTLASAADGASAGPLAASPPEAASPDGGTPLTLPVHFQQAAAPVHGLYDAPNGQIYINDDLTDHQLAVTLAHEVGHAFGLVHRTDQPSLMNPSNLMIEPQPVDIDTLETRWGACP
jgi:hypothetical protein